MYMKMKQFYCAPVMFAMLVSCGGRPAEERPTEYAVIEVTPSQVEATDRYPATIRGRQDVEIRPQVEGKITEVCVREGQCVSRGQTLFVIDQVPYKAALRTALANLSAAKAGVATARLNHDGKKELYDNKVVSLFDLQKSANALLTAEAQQEQAEAQVADARNNLSYTVVSSPADGVVGVIPYRAGTLVSSSSEQPLTTVSDNAEMYVYFSIPENSMISLIRRYGTVEKALASMPEVVLYLNDGSLYARRGRIESISGVLDAQTGSASLRAVFRNDEGLLHSGGAGSVGLVEKRDGVLAIPQSATYELQDKVFCYRLLHGKAVSTPIRVRALNEQKIYIVEEGLKAGDMIVAEGVGLLRDGMPVIVRKGGK